MRGVGQNLGRLHRIPGVNQSWGVQASRVVFMYEARHSAVGMGEAWVGEEKRSIPKAKPENHGVNRSYR